MAQNFVCADRDQVFWLPLSLREWLPRDHLAWWVIDAVAGMDLMAFYSRFALTVTAARPMIRRSWWRCCSTPTRSGSGRPVASSAGVWRMSRFGCWLGTWRRIT